MPAYTVPRSFLFAALVAALPALPAGAGETSSWPSSALASLEPSSPCAFFRSQAYGKGISHFATEMLWSCEEIAARRGAGMPLGDRLQALDAALEDYRAAVLAAGNEAFRRSRAAGFDGASFGLGEAAKRVLADRTGALAALDSVRTGF